MFLVLLMLDLDTVHAKINENIDLGSCLHWGIMVCIYRTRLFHTIACGFGEKASIKSIYSTRGQVYD